MLRSRPLALVLLVLLPAARLDAQTQAAAPGGAPAQSVAVVSFNDAVLQTAEAQRELGALQKKFAPREQQLQRLNDEIEASKKLLGTSAALSEAEKSQKGLELNAKEKTLQREAEDFKNDSQTESQQVYQRVAQKVYAFLQQFAQQHGYAAVLERGTEATPVVWYAARNVDVTEEVVKAYDARAAASGASLPEPPTAPTRSGGATKP